MSFEEQVKKLSREITELLLQKNKKYGNSALEPVRIFSSADHRDLFLL